MPPNSTVPFEIGARIRVMQAGAGQTTFVQGAGVTIRSNGGKLKCTGQYSVATLEKVATNEWFLSGDIAV